MEVYWPHISPDAKQVEFLGFVPGLRTGTYIVDMAGGEAKRVTDGFSASAWSFDGKSLIVGIRFQGKPTKPTDPNSLRLAIYNIESGKVSIIPDSQDKFGPFQPTPQMIISGGSQNGLYWFDGTTQKWAVLAEGPVENWMISPDSKYLYFVREMPENPQAMRVRFSDRKIEPIVSLKGLRRITDPALGGSSWIGVGSDGSLLLARDIGTQEIYALDVKWP